LIPFVACALGVWLLEPGWRALAAASLLVYAAAIVSFLGGIHWGLVMRDSRANSHVLMWGVSASLIAWVAVLVDLPWGLLVAAASLCICYAVDRRIYAQQAVGAWLKLRGLLTCVAALSCLVATAGLMLSASWAPH
jgi:Protein of unknown function (DUF3429)